MTGYCSQHKKEGIVDVKTERCTHDDCSKIPTYGMEGRKRRSSALNMPYMA